MTYKDAIKHDRLNRLTDRQTIGQESPYGSYVKIIHDVPTDMINLFIDKMIFQKKYCLLPDFKKAMPD